MKKGFFENYKDYVVKRQGRKAVIFCSGKRCIQVMMEYFCWPYDEIAFICDNNLEEIED